MTRQNLANRVRLTSVSATPQEIAGELIITGVPGLELKPETARFLRDCHIGGVILFTPNYESPEQVVKLINDLQGCRTELPLWISVDWEGGRVQRFREGFTRLPEAMTIGDTDSPKVAFEVAEATARELASVGINLCYAPVADIQTNPANPAIGRRSYGTTEDRVSKLVTAVVRGYLIGKVASCVKHFPGHGDTATDSHFALPSVDTTIETLRDRELKPFLKAFKSRCPMVMTAHILCKAIDPERPATFSKKILTDLLRGEMKYRGIIITDDMEMKAITDHFGADEAPVLAIEAGCDLLCYRSEAASRRAHAALAAAIESGRLPAERVQESFNRVREAKKSLLLPYHPANPNELAQRMASPEHQELLARMPKGV